MALVSGGGWDVADPFGTLFAPLSRQGGIAPDTRPIRLDVIEKPETFVIRGDIPGVDKKDINLRAQGDTLTLEVQQQQKKEENKEEEGFKWHRLERSQMWQRRSLRMPANVDLAKVKAKYDNGVLEVEVPKTQKEQGENVVNIE